MMCKRNFKLNFKHFIASIFPKQLVSKWTEKLAENNNKYHICWGVCMQNIWRILKIKIREKSQALYNSFYSQKIKKIHGRKIRSACTHHWKLLWHNAISSLELLRLNVKDLFIFIWHVWIFCYIHVCVPCLCSACGSQIKRDSLGMEVRYSEHQYFSLVGGPQTTWQRYNTSSRKTATLLSLLRFQ